MGIVLVILWMIKNSCTVNGRNPIIVGLLSHRLQRWIMLPIITNWCRMACPSTAWGFIWFNWGDKPEKMVPSVEHGLPENSHLLVGGLEHFSHILGIIIPTDWYFSEGLKPPTSLVVWWCSSSKNETLIKDFQLPCFISGYRTNEYLAVWNMVANLAKQTRNRDETHLVIQGPHFYVHPHLSHKRDTVVLIFQCLPANL